MNRITPSRSVFVLFAVAAIATGMVATAFATQFPTNSKPPTPTPSSVVINERVYNDCPTSTVTSVNNYPDLVSIHDSNIDCFGFANLHAWSFSTDGSTAVPFDNPAAFRFSATVVISGSGNGEAGLRISPWFGKNTDGRVNVRVPDGEIACFGGRLPFYTFTGAYGIHYAKGNPIRIEMIYNPHGLAPGNAATIQYRINYLGNDYDSGALEFDQGNATEDSLFGYGQWGMLNDGRVGGFVQPRLGNGNPDDLQGTFTDIRYAVTPPVNSAVTYERVFNDCPTSNLVTTNNYPSLISFDDSNVDCFGFANLHVWHFSENGTTSAIFNNNSSFRAETDFKIEGTGNGEGGLLIAPWYGKKTDGLFNVRSTDGEVACFGGRLPFYSFTGAYGLHYAKGNTIHLAVIYDAHGRTATDPATIQYQAVYLGVELESPQIAFDQGNAHEDSLFGYGQYGMLNDGAAGGHFKAFLGQGTPVEVKGSFSNIRFSTCLHPANVSFEIRPNHINFDSHGRLLTVYITAQDPSTIDVSSLRLNGVAPLTSPGPVLQGNGVLKVRFDRAAVLSTLSSGDQVAVTLTGEVGGDCLETVNLVSVRSPHILAPAPNAQVITGRQTDVTWDIDPDATSMSLLYSANDGATWSVVATGIANTGTYRWLGPNSPTSTARLALAAVYETDETGVVNQYEYAASGAFTVASPLSVDGGRIDFSLRTKNPASGALRTSFSLPTSAAAELSVYDIAGREVVKREVGGHAGAQSVTLGKLPTGVYMVRLTHAGQTLSNRVAVIQ